MNAADTAMAEYCDGDAFFYAQTPCVIPAREIKPRLVMGLAVSCMALLVVFFSITYISYARGVQAYQYVEFDYKTLSTADYTVELPITAGMWQTFLDTYFDHKNPISEIGQFRLYMIRELERRLA